jgi:hypothetical protein
MSMQQKITATVSVIGGSKAFHVGEEYTVAELEGAMYNASRTPEQNANDVKEMLQYFSQPVSYNAPVENKPTEVKK